MKKIVTSMDEMKARRIELGMTQQEVAKKARISLKSYADWENKKRKPANLNAYSALAYALDCVFEIDGITLGAQSNESRLYCLKHERNQMINELEEELNILRKEITKLEKALAILKEDV